MSQKFIFLLLLSETLGRLKQQSVSRNFVETLDYPDKLPNEKAITTSLNKVFFYSQWNY